MVPSTILEWLGIVILYETITLYSKNLKINSSVTKILRYNVQTIIIIHSLNKTMQLPCSG